MQSLSMTESHKTKKIRLIILTIILYYGWPRKWNGERFYLLNMPFIAPAPPTALVVGDRPDLLRHGQNIGPGLA